MPRASWDQRLTPQHAWTINSLWLIKYEAVLKSRHLQSPTPRRYIHKSPCRHLDCLFNSLFGPTTKNSAFMALSVRKTPASDGFAHKQWCSKCFYIMMSSYFTCCFVRIDFLQKCGVLLLSLWQALIHRGRMTHVCINKLSHHWFKKGFVAFSVPSYYQTDIQTEPFRKSWMKIELEHIPINQIKYIWKCSLQNV